MTKQIPYDLIPASDLPRSTPGAFDSVVGVDESTGAARRFPMPVTGAPKAYETRADLPASASEGTAAYVNNDPTPANNGLWAFLGGAWVQSADRVTGLEGRLGSVEGAFVPVSSAFPGMVSLDVYELLPGRVEIYIDAAGHSRVASSTTSGTLQRYPAAATSISSVGTGASLAAGGANVRSIRGGGSISATVDGDTVVIQDDAPDILPTEFVVCLVIGQSNNTVEGGNAALATPVPAGVAYEYRDTQSALLDLATDANAQRATVMPGMALEFWRRTGLGVIFVNSAIGSSAMAAAASPDGLPTRNWDTTGNLRALAVTRLNAARAMATAEGLNWQNGWISWSQGEQDGLKIDQSVITVDDYEAAFAGLVSYLHENVGGKVPLIITRTAYRSADTAGYQQVRAAQMEFAATIPGVYMGYTGTLSFFSRGMMNDSVHYNQAGKNEVGKRIGAVASVLAAGVN